MACLRAVAKAHAEAGDIFLFEVSIGVTWSGGSSFGPVPLYQDALAQERGIVGMAGYGMDSDEIRLSVDLFL